MSSSQKEPMIVRWKDNIVEIGAGRPVVIQSMTNTDTADVESSTKQVLELAQAGSELVRLTVNTPAAAKAIPEIRRRLDEAGCFVPLVGDFHYNGHKLLTEYPECAEALSKYRINPGNVGKGDKQEENFRTMIELAKKYDKPVRIGVNWGSLDQDLLARMMSENQKLENPLDAKEVLREALVRGAVENADRAVELGMKPSQVAISAKVSGVKDLIAVYRELEARCAYPLHLGLTEAGMGLKGTVSTTAALSVLLLENIGDTIRVSLTPEPGQSRTAEVELACEILQALGMRNFTPQVVSCPGCGRTTSCLFQELAKETQDFIKLRMPDWRKHNPGVENMNVAVMGCVVNGPGESRHANIGISLPGSGEAPVSPVFIDGKKWGSLKGPKMSEEFHSLIEEYVQKNYQNAKEQ